MSNDPTAPDPEDAVVDRLQRTSIEEELRTSYMTYAMSVIVSRALPDVRDGLKPSQRRILVAMNDLNLRPGSGTIKCAKISGDTSGNYHPHGESVIYPTLVRMAQEWNMRHPLVDKQGNFGSIAGLPPAAMRYTEARLSAEAALMMDDINLDTVDFVPTYDGRNTEPVVLPSKFPNLLVNGSSGIAVGMTTSIPPHNLGETCKALVHLIDNPDATVDELMEHLPGPDFPTGGIICGRFGIRQAYHTGRGIITVRARAHVDEKGKRPRIIITEIPFQQTRDRIVEKIADLIRDDRIKGIIKDGGLRDESDFKNPVRIVLELNREGDPDVILNQLYQFSPLQDTFSIIFLALVDGAPLQLSLKGLLQEFLRHRLLVIRRRTQFLLSKARRRKHSVEGLLIAFANIDEIIRIIRTSATQPEAKERLLGVNAPAAMIQRVLGDAGFELFQSERGVSDEYPLTPVQAEDILRMRLAQLVNLEQEKLGDEYRNLLDEINEYLRILSDDANIYAIIRDDLLQIADRHANTRRTEISHEELGNVDIGDLITEETMVVTVSHRGYIKRTPSKVYRAQRRGGKGLKGAKTEDEDPIEMLFVASTHDYMLFFTNLGRVYWQKVYDLPQLSRESRGRAIINLLQLGPEERVANCLTVRDFSDEDHYLLMATRDGLVKKTPLKAYSRPLRGGIIAIKLREGDEVVAVKVVNDQDEILLSTAKGMAIRFSATDARSMGRNTSGVKGISLGKGDYLVAMVVADPNAELLTVCEKGHGKRTPFGPNGTHDEEVAETNGHPEDEEAVTTEADEPEVEEEEEVSSSRRYRVQRRGGKGVRDIKTSKRNGQVISAVRVTEEDEVLMITASGKIQRIAANEISIVGRNTQGVRIMNVDEDDTLVAVVPVPREETEAGAELIANETLPVPEGETPPTEETTSEEEE